jgi:hypothetical protein
VDRGPGIVLGRWRGQRELVVALQRDGFFSDDEAEACKLATAAAIRAADGDMDRVGVLTFTDGAGPTAAQRADMRDFLGGRQLRLAVVSASRLTRGIVTAISWFNPAIRVFAPAELARAYTYLDVSADGERGLWAEIERLDARMHLAVVAALRADVGRAARP